MSGITLPPQVGGTAADNTTVPADIQKQLQDYWRQFGPNHGEIAPTTNWDGGATPWDQGATIWVS